MVLLKRQEIITEVINRLGNDGSGDGRGLRRDTDPITSTTEWNIGRTPIYVGIGKRLYPPKTTPQVIILPYDSDLSREQENHPYIETFSLGVELFIKCSAVDPQEHGNLILRRIQEAIELDKRFKQMDMDESSLTYGKLINGTELAIFYGMEDRQILELGSDLLYVSSGYHFRYKEEFLGKRST